LRHNEALYGARGQIAWIAALVLSTTAIIYLESLDFRDPRQSATVSENLAASAAQALAAAEQRHRISPDDSEAKIALVLALSVAVQAGIIDAAEGRSRMASLPPPTPAAPGWESVGVLVDLTFRE
jgi:hypothetical protein